MADPFFANVVLLAVNDNQPDGTTTFVDQAGTPHTLTTNGSAQYDTAQAPTGMTSSMLLDGTGDYLSTPDSADWAFGNGDFTIELMAKFAAVASNRIFVGQASNSTGAGSFLLAGQSGASKLEGYYTTGGTTATRRDVDNTAWAPGTTNWHHVAWTRSGTSSFMFVDGTQHGATFNSGTDTLFDAALQLCIGADSGGGAAINGWLSNVRITKGVARYTANFTPPSLPFPITAVDPPVADFSGTPLSGTVPLSVTFTDLSTNTPTSWAWTFGDGDTDTVQNPTHIYAAAGTYTVALTATNAGGSDQDVKTNYITVTTAPVPTTGGGKGDNERRRQRRNVPFKPTGFLDRPSKPVKEGRKEVSDRVDESAQIAAEVAGKLAKEFSDETLRIGRIQEAKDIVEMSMAEVDREIGILLRKKLRTDEDELNMFVLMAAAA